MPGSSLFLPTKVPPRQVRELVRYKVDMTAVNSKGFTPMDVACLYGHTKVRATSAECWQLALSTCNYDITVPLKLPDVQHDFLRTVPRHPFLKLISFRGTLS